MSIRSLIISVFLLAWIPCHSQSGPDSNAVQQAIIKQAEKACNALIKQDYNEFIKFTLPEVVVSMGGKEKMIARLQQGTKDMEKQGIKFLSVAIGTPSKIIIQKKEWQCTIPETIEMKVPDGRLEGNSTLIGISDDKGKHWFFVDANGQDIKALQKVLPQLSGQLELPEKKEPLFYPE